MNDLIVVNKEIKPISIPKQISEVQRRRWKIIDDMWAQIHSFEDFIHMFVEGQGLSKHTYKAYTYSVKAFYYFTQGKHPKEVELADLEAFFDYQLEKNGRGTAVLRITALRRVFKLVEKKDPSFISPFTDMPKKLRQKIARARGNYDDPEALTQKEVKLLLNFLKKDHSWRGKRLYAIILLMLCTGLRAAEAVSLVYGDLEKIDGVWYVSGEGKGGRRFHQEIATPEAVDAINVYHLAQWGELPQEDHFCFYNRNGDGLGYEGLWRDFDLLDQQVLKAKLFERRVRIHPHLLRATYITMLIENGMEIHEVMKKSRHRNADTILKYYAAVRGKKASDYLKSVFTDKE